MKAQVLYGIGNIKYAEIDIPVPKEGEALIKLSRCGICGSDIPRIYKTGAHNMPLIPGHEMMGVVVSCPTAPDIEGKRVGVFPLIPCMRCPQCRQKHYEMCNNYNYLGSRCDGGFAEYVAAPVWNLIEVPDEITDDEAAMLEPMCVAVHAMRRTGMCESSFEKETSGTDRVSKDKNIMICGLGTIGLLLAMFVRDAGYSNVFFVGNKDIQLAKLRDMGISDKNVCDVRYGDPYEFIMDRTEGAGADVYFECIGRPESYEQAIKCCAPLGKVMLVGNPSADMGLKRENYWQILRKQETLLGTWNSSFYGHEGDNVLSFDSIGTGKEDYPERADDWTYAITRLSEWKKNDLFHPGDLVTHRFKLADAQYGFDIMHRKSEEYVKIMLDL